MTQSLPLVVDLDGALTLADTLDEGVVGAVCRRPLSALSAVSALAQGRAAFKVSVRLSRLAIVEYVYGFRHFGGRFV